MAPLFDRSCEISMDIQWFPGHMAKTKRLISENLKLVDCVIELADARLPRSSRNPEMDRMASGKPRLLLLNKADLADESANREWVAAYKEQGLPAILVSSLSGKGYDRIVPMVKELLKEKIARDKERGLVNRPIKLMIVGIPNVGKSSFINRFAKKGSLTKTGDRPGVTKGKQWIRLSSGFELLDTPGILWPKFDDQEIARRLAFTGAIKDEILDTVELSWRLLEFLAQEYPKDLAARYKLQDFAGETGDAILEKICRRRGFIVSGGELDLDRGAAVLLDEFRSAKIGRITLERP